MCVQWDPYRKISVSCGAVCPGVDETGLPLVEPPPVPLPPVDPPPPVEPLPPEAEVLTTTGEEARGLAEKDVLPMYAAAIVCDPAESPASWKVAVATPLSATSVELPTSAPLT